ncbi:hypothetical protein CsSME_00045593 [Camellia sinensis var. sinensis]
MPKIKKKQFEYVFRVSGTYAKVLYEVPYASKSWYGMSCFLKYPCFINEYVSCSSVLVHNMLWNSVPSKSSILWVVGMERENKGFVIYESSLLCAHGMVLYHQ